MAYQKKTSAVKVKADVYPAENIKGVLAFANITIADCFVVKGICVRESKDGKDPFVCMPAKQINGEWKDQAFPITKEMRKAIVDAIFNEME